MAGLPLWTNPEVIQQLDSGMHLTGTQWTFAFPTSNTWIPSYQQEHSGFSPLNTSQQGAAKLAMQLWDDLIAPNTTFNGNNPNSTILMSNNVGTSAYSYAYYPDQAGWEGSSAWINSNYAELRAPKVGDYSFQTYLHELGHTIGLDHMGNYNGSADYAVDASSVQDSHLYSVMSYFPVWETGQANWTVGGVDYYAQTPMLNDILAIQSIYGADLTTRTGNTTYGFHASGISPTEAQVYDFSVNKHPIMTIYDAGGNDTLDLSGYATASTIDLNAGHFSSAAGMTNNIGIAYNTTIENAVGGLGNDTLIGNAANNLLVGGLGSDTLIGGLGNDTYVVDNARDVVIESAGGGVDTVQSSISFALGANVENLTLTGVAGLTGTGNELDNIIIGNGGRDTLSGGAGNDKIYGGVSGDNLSGGAGNDWLHGGLGANTLDGGLGMDVFDFGVQPSGFAQDTILDFAVSGIDHDVIEIAKALAPNFAYMVSHHELAQVGANAVLTLSSNETVKLIGVDVHQITAADFLFA